MPYLLGRYGISLEKKGRVKNRSSELFNSLSR